MQGSRTVLYPQARPSYEPGADRPSEFATLHAAASVLPHSVASPNVSHWTGISQAFFRALSHEGGSGVRNQVHYEIFEDPIQGLPDYAQSVENFEVLTADKLKETGVPRRSGAKETHGWKFDAFFSDAPQYLRYLYALYEDIGGRVVDPPGDRDLPAYLALDHDIYVNCTGIGAYAFLESAAKDKRFTDAPSAPDFEPLIDPVPPKLIRGHYLRIDTRQVLTGERGKFLSYNYKPSATIYRTAKGAPADVYCYQRLDEWILGGSRQEGRIDKAGNWVGEETVGEEIEFPRPDAAPLAVPSAILKLNADILLRISNGAFDLERMVRNDPAIVSPGIGYRFVRDSESSSVRIGCSRVNFSGTRKYILHNYGHGGSGFTLSWGCAFDVRQLLGRIIGPPPRPSASPVQSKADLRYDAIQQTVGDLLCHPSSIIDPASKPASG